MVVALSDEGVWIHSGVFWWYSVHTFALTVTGIYGVCVCVCVCHIDHKCSMEYLKAQF